jgi:hypothetical protein
MEKPDKEIEEFWLGYKVSMINFYGTKSIPPRPISHWSNILNNLQKQEDYLSIERHIRDYMLLYAIDIIRYNSYYHGGILQTNIKRWNRICNANNAIGMNTSNKNQQKIIGLFDIFIKLRDEESQEMQMELSYIFGDIELFIIYDLYDHLIEFAVRYNRPFILDGLNDIVDIYPYIWRIYPETANQKMKFRKMIDIIRKPKMD